MIEPEEAQPSLVGTIKEIAKENGWTTEEFLEAILKGLAKLDPELTESQAQALIDELDEMS